MVLFRKHLIFKFIYSLAVVLYLSLIAGCATQNVKLQETFIKNTQQKTLVATTPVKKPNLYKVGPMGILDIAITEIPTRQFVNHLQAFDLTWYEALQNSLIEKLRMRNIPVELSKKPIEIYNLPVSHMDSAKYATKKYSILKNQLDGDNLLILNIETIGASRAYYGFIPISSPQAVFYITAELVNLRTNEVYWRYRAGGTQSVVGKWDQPPNYPNFDKALKSIINTATTKIADNFSSNVR